MICLGGLRWASRNRSTSSALDHRRIVADLVIAGRQRPAQLEPVQRRLARHRRAILAPGFELAGEDRHHRVMPELVVVDQVLIAQRQSEHALADQRLDLVLDQLLAARVAEAGREAIDETDRPIGRAKQQRAGVRSDASAVESRHHRTAFDGLQIQTNPGYSLFASRRSANSS